MCTGAGATCGASGCTVPISDDYALLGLFDASGSIRVSGGAPVPVELLKPIIYFAPGALASQLVGQSFCTGVHFTAAANPAAMPNAGPIAITGYKGGTDGTGMAVPSSINCAIENGVYVCGYGALSDAGTAGTDPSGDPLTASGGLLGTSSIMFSSPGGPDGGYGAISASAVPASAIGVQEDLSTIQYSGTADTTLTLDCADAGTCGVGMILAMVQASSNGAQDYEAPTAASSGTVVCLSAFGSVEGFTLGPDSITITQAAIASMLDGDPSLVTFATTVGTLPEATLLDLAGGGSLQVGMAATASYGVSTTIPLTSPDGGGSGPQDAGRDGG
jgi:hypothetical protein